MVDRVGGPRCSTRRRWLAVLAGLAWAAAASADGPADEALIPESRFEELLESGSAEPLERSRPYREADLAPYFSCSAARARGARGGEAPPARYLRATAALRSDPAAAALQFRALAADYPQLRDRCLFNAARALERVRKRSAAAAAYGEVSPGSALHAAAQLARSRVLERALELDAALEALAPVRALPVNPRNDAVRRSALLAAARLHQKRNDYAGEHRAMLELWATSPLSREAEIVWERLRELPIPNRWRLRRAESFLSFHQNAEALRLASQVKTALPDDHACRAAWVVGSALRKERRHRQAIAALAPMVEACSPSELRADALYVLGYSQSLVAKEDAVRTYETLAREFPEHPFADDALFFAAELDLRLGRQSDALRRLEELAARYPQGNFAPDALFQIAWQHRAAAAYGPALSALERLARLARLDRDQQLRVRYWRARTLEDLGDPMAAEAFAELAVEHPATWYGWLARGRLRDDAPEPSPGEVAARAAASPWPLEAGPLADDPRFLAGVELLRLDLRREAAEELLAIDPRGLPADAARLLVEAVRRTGHDRAAARVTRATLGRELSGGVDDRTVEIWKATYPRPYRKAIQRWAQASRVEPDLLLALMREESRFDPSARSSTGAIGLTQLMPQTARRKAAELRLGRITPDALRRPELNIRLGAACLGELLSTFDGSSVHALAAYNAGPEAVWRWMRARPDAELDEWVEQIPATETRGYVKRVLGSYRAYQLVYGAAVAVVDGR